MAERRGRLTRELAAEHLEDLNVLVIEVDVEGTARAWTDVLPLADRHRLTVYDATYLELALRRGSKLATLDSELRAAGRKEGLAVLP
jgi:predicted nucleic acid-binding protein